MLFPATAGDRAARGMKSAVAAGFVPGEAEWPGAATWAKLMLGRLVRLIFQGATHLQSFEQGIGESGFRVGAMWAVEIDLVKINRHAGVFH